MDVFVSDANLCNKNMHVYTIKSKDDGVLNAPFKTAWAFIFSIGTATTGYQLAFGIGYTNMAIRRLQNGIYDQWTSIK